MTSHTTWISLLGIKISVVLRTAEQQLIVAVSSLRLKLSLLLLRYDDSDHSFKIDSENNSRRSPPFPIYRGFRYQQSDIILQESQHFPLVPYSVLNQSTCHGVRFNCCRCSDIPHVFGNRKLGVEIDSRICSIHISYQIHPRESTTHKSHSTAATTTTITVILKASDILCHDDDNNNKTVCHRGYILLLFFQQRQRRCKVHAGW